VSKTAKKLDSKTPEKTVFLCQAQDAQSVCLSGTFNDWDPNATSMKRQKNDGTWRAELELAPGRYEYKFVVDGVWCCEPGRDDTQGIEGCVPNPFGTMNRVVEVGEGPQSRAVA
jgi:hypothetical protein